MKRFFFILLVLLFASSASASVYKWVDERGVVNFADDTSKVPPNYRNQVEEINIARMGTGFSSQISPSGNTSKQVPPIAQPLVREGDFAIKLAQAFGLGQAKSDAEAESMLTQAGVSPKNGWITDYPVTPDVIGELTKAISDAADAGGLPLGKDKALRAFRTSAVELELPVIAEVPNGYLDNPPPTVPQYADPSAINNYFYNDGPPVVTYYPPPPDYYYLYGWVPSPFWYSGFYFPGFFILHDFHRVVYANRYPRLITNHVRDPRTGSFSTVSPARRYQGSTFGAGRTPNFARFNSGAARNGAQSIYDRSSAQVASANTAAPVRDRAVTHYSNSGRSTAYSSASSSNGRNNKYGRPSVANGDRGYGMNFQRSSAGESHSFSSPAPSGASSFGSSSHVGGSHFSSSPTAGRGFSGSHHGGGGGGRGGGSGHGGRRS
jgi:hypothetical protein